MSEEEDVDQPDLTARQRWAALGSVVRLAFTVAPWAVALSAVGIVIDSVLPILTTFFAAKTTTVLAEAVAGESGAAPVLPVCSMGTLMTRPPNRAWAPASRSGYRS